MQREKFFFPLQVYILLLFVVNYKFPKISILKVKDLIITHSGLSLTLKKGRAIAQAVSRWLPTARIRARVLPSGICGGQSGAGAGFFSEYFGFLCQSSFHQFLHHHIHSGQVQ
jgi:hypothetical protein